VLIHLETSSGVPIYRQIVEQIRQQIALRRLGIGERIPSVRDLARSLAVNPLTVAKAYTELEREGLIETRRGVGTFVAQGRPRLAYSERVRLVRELAERLAAESVRLEVPPDRVEALVRDLLERYARSDDHE
jgi:GntR family transcriptional regulator